jgi:hypothetical protein
MRGIFYSVMAAVVIIPIVMLMMVYVDSLKIANEQYVIKTRGDELVFFIDSVYTDLHRGLDITSKRSMAVAVSYIVSNGTWIDDAELRLSELMLNGSFYGEISGMMGSETFTGWIERVEAVGQRYGFYTNITVRSLEVRPHDSFHVNFTVYLKIEVRDLINFMNISRNFSRSIFTSIENFEDPFYPLHTSGFVKRIFSRPNVTIYDVSGVDAGIAGQFYMSTAHGPGFLDRLEGRYGVSALHASQSPWDTGLDSFVDLLEITSRGLIVKSTQSCVDHYYFENVSHQGYAVSGSSYSWFKIDNETHAVMYGVQDDLIP